MIRELYDIVRENPGITNYQADIVFHEHHPEEDVSKLHRKINGRLNTLRKQGLITATTTRESGRPVNRWYAVQSYSECVAYARDAVVADGGVY